MNADFVDVAVMNECLKSIPDRAWTHEGCPFCKGKGKIPFVAGDVWMERDCSYWGGTYRIIERAAAMNDGAFPF
jgi:hypothetical protein